MIKQRIIIYSVFRCKQFVWMGNVSKIACIRGGIYHAIHRYAKANNKYMNNYDKNKESSYIQYLDANNLYGWAMSQKLPVDGFKWEKNMLKFNEDFIKSYDGDSDKGYIFEVDVEYPKNLHDLHSDLPFLPE